MLCAYLKMSIKKPVGFEIERKIVVLYGHKEIIFSEN
jgi:hypothetical protein